MEEAFLNGLADDQADGALRLVYADWLEERGDPRAEFLRVHEALAGRSREAEDYRRLCEREQDLVRRLDPDWVLRVRRFTTPAPCRDIAALVPELAPFARTAIRLHPRRITTPLSATASKIGGRFLWPKGEKWPSCERCQIPLAAVVQLRARDVPGIEFPPGADLLQLFWCPNEAEHDYQLVPRVWWRAAASITDPWTEEPTVARLEGARTGGVVPFPCSVRMEPVVEYPLDDSLYHLAGPQGDALIRQRLDEIDLGPAPDLAERFSGQAGLRSFGSLAFYELGRCRGSKVVGETFVDEGRRFERLVTLSTCEFDAASFRRWLPIEDQRWLARPGEAMAWRDLARSPHFTPLREPTGMQLGRTQRAHVFVCRDREPWEVTANVGD